jgi:HSP20 family protein
MALLVRQQNARPGGWDPLGDIEHLYTRMAQALEDQVEQNPLLRDGFTPLADIEETDDAFEIEVELPGVKKRDVDVSVVGRRVTISGERVDKERVGVLRRRTRGVGRFRYEVTLPNDLDEDGVKASLKDGVLTVRVPKATSETRRRIEVE